MLEQHCVAHREDLGIDDACKHISLMKDIETLLRTVYTLFCRSSVTTTAFAELAEVLECESVAFRPLNEVRWLSRHFALMRNIAVLVEYCKEQAETHSDPVCKYCYKKLTDPQVRAALIVFDDVDHELAELNKLLQRSNLTSIEAVQFLKARITKLRLQYLSEMAHWNDEAREYMQSNRVVNIAIIKVLQYYWQYFVKYRLAIANTLKKSIGNGIANTFVPKILPIIFGNTFTFLDVHVIY